MIEGRRIDMDIKSIADSSQKNITIFFNNYDSDRISFNGKYLPELEKPNWHYYQTDDGYMIHCRKEHMLCVVEKINE